VSEAIARSARERRESRGAHSRIDFPDPDTAWSSKNNVIRYADDAMQVETTALPGLTKDLRQLISTETSHG
jgi:succinate dehydrogenase / fumarate reductase flavoprotein subunit